MKKNEYHPAPPYTTRKAIMNQQATFGEIVGLPNSVPCARLPHDNVTCHVTGKAVPYCDSFHSYDGKYFLDDADRLKYDLDALREFLDATLQWATEYYESEDAADAYAHYVGESDQINNTIKTWLEEEYNIDPPDKLIQDISCILIEQMEVDIVSEYSRTNFDLTFGGFDCGETEEQVDIGSHELLQTLHNNGILNSLLDELDGDYCFCRSSSYDPKTKTRTRDDIVSSGDDPIFSFYHYPGVWYFFGCSADTAREAYEEYTTKE